MENTNSFYGRNKAYILTLGGLGVVGFIFVQYMMIFDWAYLLKFTFDMVTGGGVDGAVTPSSSTYKLMVDTAFGQNYEAIAPEIIRARVYLVGVCSRDSDILFYVRKIW